MQIPEQYLHETKLWIAQKRSKEEIKIQLQADGVDEATLDLILTAYIKQAARSRALQRGIKLIGIGAFFLFMGFFCTICFNDTGFNEKISLYGFTSLGGTLLIAGMMYIFG